MRVTRSNQSTITQFWVRSSILRDPTQTQTQYYLGTSKLTLFCLVGGEGDGYEEEEDHDVAGVTCQSGLCLLTDCSQHPALPAGRRGPSVPAVLCWTESSLLAEILRQCWDTTIDHTEVQRNREKWNNTKRRRKYLESPEQTKMTGLF